MMVQLYLVPVVSVVGGAIILQESVTVLTVLGGAAMLIAVWIATGAGKTQNASGSNGRNAGARSRAFYVTGSGLVLVPVERANEIPRLIAEHHAREAQLERTMAWVRRC